MKTQNSQGFSLVEILISLAILGFGLLALAKLQATLLTGGDHARQLTEAANIGQGVIENLRSFSAIVDDTSGNDYMSLQEEERCVYSPYENTNTEFNVKCVISPLSADNDSYKTVTVTVTWLDRTNESQSVILNSIITRSDPVDGGKFMLADNAGF